MMPYQLAALVRTDRLANASPLTAPGPEETTPAELARFFGGSVRYVHPEP